MNDRIEVGDEVRLLKFPGGSGPGWNERMDEYVGEVIVVEEVRKDKPWIKYKLYNWPMSACELIARPLNLSLSQGKKVKISNDNENFTEEATYDRTEGDWHIVQTATGFKPVKYIQE